MKTPPTGLGMWIAFHDLAAPKGDWLSVAEKCNQHGIKWLAIRAGESSRQPDWTPQTAKTITAALQANGIGVYPWWYSVPGTAARQVELARSLMGDGANGIICDAEAEWIGHDAMSFLTDLRTAIGDAFLAHAPFDHPLNFPKWPWHEFNSVCDAVMPQAYWTEHDNRGAAATIASVDPQWSNRGLNVMPIGVTYGKGSKLAPKAPGTFHADDLRTFLDHYKDRQAVSLYSWENADVSVWDALK